MRQLTRRRCRTIYPLRSKIAAERGVTFSWGSIVRPNALNTTCSERRVRIPPPHQFVDYDKRRTKRVTENSESKCSAPKEGAEKFNDGY